MCVEDKKLDKKLTMNMGMFRFVLMFGLGVFGGWMSFIYLFVYAANGVAVDLRRSMLALATSLIISLVWGVLMWGIFTRVRRGRD